jgi:hypothetical protein
METSPQDLTVVAIAFSFAGAVVKGLYDFLKSRKGGNTNELQTILVNNTKAIERLTEVNNQLFLYIKTRDAGKDVEQVYLKEQLDSIEGKIDKLQESQTKHISNCKLICQRE